MTNIKLDFEQRQQAERMAENGDQLDQCFELVWSRAEINHLREFIEKRSVGAGPGADAERWRLIHEWRKGGSAEPPAQLQHVCLVAGCTKHALVAKDGAVGALCEEHNGNVGLRSEPASRASPADLVGALQDVVHTDPGPVRAGHAVREESSEVHRQLHKCEHCGAITKIDCISDFQLIQYICATCGKETRAHEVFEATAVKSGVGRDAEARWLLNHSITRETRHEWTNRRDAWLGRPLTYPDHESAGAQFCIHCGESHAAPPCEDPIKSSSGETFPRVTVASIPIVVMDGSEQPPGELTFSNSKGDVVKIIGLGAKSGEQP